MRRVFLYLLERLRMAFQSVDAYIAAQPDSVRSTLARVRALIRDAVPAAEEMIAYDMPTYRVGGKRFVHFAAWKQHYALYGMNEAVRAAFKAELAHQDVDGSTIRFRYADPIPEDLITRLVRFRASLQGERAI